MRTLPYALAALVLFVAVPSARAQECRCNDNAASIVLKSSAGTLVACDTLRTVDPADKMRSEVTVSIDDSDAAAISAKLSELYGAEVAFAPAAEGERVTVDLHHAPLWRALDDLSRRGQVRVRGLDYNVIRQLREDFAGGGVTGSFSGAKLAEVLAALSIVTGDEITASADDGAKVVTLDFTAVRLPLRDLLKRLAADTHAKIHLRRAEQ